MALIPTTYDPIRAFKFQVTILGGTEGDITLGFQKVSGLKTSSDIVEYREGNMAIHKIKMPGLTNYEPLTLTRGAGPSGVEGAQALINWRYEVAGYGNPAVNHDGIALSPADNRAKTDGGNFRRTVFVNVYDKGISTTNDGMADKAYTLHLAWPSELSVSDLNAEASEVLIESMVLQHEGLELTDVNKLKNAARGTR